MKTGKIPATGLELISGFMTQNRHSDLLSAIWHEWSQGRVDSDSSGLSEIFDGSLLVLEQFHAQKWLKKWLKRVLCRLKSGENSIKNANFGLIGGELRCIFIGDTAT